ncbi:MAG: carboxylesterase family protein [Dehalococcoidia bacterium]
MTTAQTSYGKLEGAQLDGGQAFKGVPFAKAPVGQLRWAPPQRPEPWAGVRAATAYAPASLQAQSPISTMMGMSFAEGTSEDCLFLNVWTPSADSGARPVMVFIHGGAFVIGAGSQSMYNGEHLARRGGVVVVTINYRLGALGFVRLGAATNGSIPATGNEAILDQIAALEWVRDEIAAFGGDPANVTVFGESAGSISIAGLLASPQARGLFRRAILQSGSANLITVPAAADQVGAKIVSDLAVGTDAAALRAMPAERVMEAQDRATPRTGGVSYAPVADGETIALDPFEAIAGRSAAGIDILIGSNLDEMNLFRFMDPSSDNLDEAGLLARVSAAFGDRAGDTVAAYKDAVSARGDEPTAPKTWLALQTDQVFRAPAMKLAALQAAHSASVYGYRFDHKSDAFGGILGAAHALELPFVFGTLSDPGFGTVMGGANDVTTALSDRMQDAWLAFARTGNPSTESLPAWPRYEAGRRATMLFSSEPRVTDAPEERTRALWD